MFLGLDPFRLLLLPVAMLLFSCFSLLSFKTLLLAVTRASKNTYQQELVTTYVQPALKNVVKMIEEVVGKADSIKFNFNHVLMMATLLAIIAVAGALLNRADAEEAERREARKVKRE